MEADVVGALVGDLDDDPIVFLSSDGRPGKQPIDGHDLLAPAKLRHPRRLHLPTSQSLTL